MVYQGLCLFIIVHQGLSTGFSLEMACHRRRAADLSTKEAVVEAGVTDEAPDVRSHNAAL